MRLVIALEIWLLTVLAAWGWYRHPLRIEGGKVFAEGIGQVAEFPTQAQAERYVKVFGKYW